MVVAVARAPDERNWLLRRPLVCFVTPFPSARRGALANEANGSQAPLEPLFCVYEAATKRAWAASQTQKKRRFSSTLCEPLALCGERGIRTPGTVARSPHFECGPIDHSGISPIATANIEIIFQSMQLSDKKKLKKLKSYPKSQQNARFKGVAKQLGEGMERIG